MKPICIVIGCENPNCSQGMCFKHYRRWQRYGVTDLPARPTGCTVPGCDRRYRCSGYCSLHYGRWIRTGSTEDPDPRPVHCVADDCGDSVIGWGLCESHYRQHHANQSDEVCSISGCDRPVRARTWCQMHYARWKENGSEYWEPPGPQTYASWHGAIRRVKGGPARDHACVDCGRRADEWSYDRQDPDERRDAHTGKPAHWAPYSTNVDHYQPRCRSCHRTLDNNYYNRDDLVDAMLLANQTRETMADIP